jgi:hypothetical protein
MRTLQMTSVRPDPVASDQLEMIDAFKLGEEAFYSISGSSMLESAMVASVEADPSHWPKAANLPLVEDAEHGAAN